MAPAPVSLRTARAQSTDTRGATGTPRSASSMAGASRRSSGMLPWSSSSRHQPSTAPGTVTACTLVVSMRLMAFFAYHAAVAAFGARPAALSAMGLPPGLATMAKQSPPIPVIGHSTTASTAAVAIAASTALPPAFRMSMAARLAAGCEVAHIARRP